MTNNSKNINSYFGLVRTILCSFIGAYINCVYGTTLFLTYLFGLCAGILMTDFFYPWFKTKFIEKQ
jgi:hypothetical protein